MRLLYSEYLSTHEIYGVLFYTRSRPVKVKATSIIANAVHRTARELHYTGSNHEPKLKPMTNSDETLRENSFPSMSMISSRGVFMKVEESNHKNK